MNFKVNGFFKIGINSDIIYIVLLCIVISTDFFIQYIMMNYLPYRPALHLIDTYGFTWCSLAKLAKITGQPTAMIWLWIRTWIRTLYFHSDPTLETINHHIVQCCYEHFNQETLHLEWMKKVVLDPVGT